MLKHLFRRSSSASCDARSTQRLLVLGMAKTGTTALYSAIKTQFPQDSGFFFEPPDLQEVCRHAHSPLLAKVLISDEPFLTELTRHVDKTLLLVRDPRDTLVSNTLYSAIAPHMQKNTARFNAFLHKVEEKEKNPRSIPLLELWMMRTRPDRPQEHGGALPEDVYAINNAETFRRYFPRLLAFQQNTLRIAREGNNVHVLRYEDFIDGNTKEAEAFLGITLAPSVTVEQGHRRVERTRSYGGWKDWLTPHDVAVLKGAFAPYMDAFSYNDSWQLHPQPDISPQSASGYIRSITQK